MESWIFCGLIGCLVIAYGLWRWVGPDEDLRKGKTTPTRKKRDPVMDAIYNPKEFRKPKN